MIRDLYFIHQSIKNSLYSEEVQKIKKNNIKKNSKEIDDSLIIYEKSESLHPIIKANYQIFRDYIMKIKGVNA
jgi:hypothetical protein